VAVTEADAMTMLAEVEVRFVLKAYVTFKVGSGGTCATVTEVVEVLPAVEAGITMLVEILAGIEAGATKAEEVVLLVMQEAEVEILLIEGAGVEMLLPVVVLS